MIFKLLFLVLLSMITVNAFSQQPPLEPGVSQSLAQWRAVNYSDVRYKLNLTLERGAPLMKGSIEISVKLTERGAQNDLILDWRTTQFQNDKDKPYARVTSLNGKTPLVIEAAEHLRISRENLKPGENTIKIEFASPIKTSGAGITRYIDKEDGGEYLYSLFVPSDASTAFPLFDQPDLKARFQLELLVPLRWRSVSNTKAASVTQIGNSSRFIFPETNPISTYVFAFATGDFAEFSKSAIVTGNMNVVDSEPPGDEPTPETKIYVRKSQIEKFKQHQAEVFRLNREGVKFLESYFDYKFPFPKYDLVLIPEFPFGGMEHAGATFLREASVIFPTEPTKNDYVSRANVIFHEAAHQWFGDTVTMKWFDDLWLKEGFAEFMAYKTLEKVMPEYNAWKIFYERNKQAAYLTDSTKGTTPIYQEIPNLSAAKSAYGNIVYRKAPSFLRQTEFYLGEKEFQTAVRAFLKNHQYANATWQDLVKEIEEVKVIQTKSGEFYQKLSDKDKAELERFTRWQINTEWADFWINKPGMPTYRISPNVFEGDGLNISGGALGGHTVLMTYFTQKGSLENYNWLQDIKVLKAYDNGEREIATAELGNRRYAALSDQESKTSLRKGEYTFPGTYKNFDKDEKPEKVRTPLYVFPNYQDYGYGIFLLDDKSRAYVLKNIQTEKDDFLRAMMWGSLWDSVRETELAPADYVRLVIKNINVETDESTIQTLLGRTSAAMNYYLSDKQREEVAAPIENLLLEKMQNAATAGQKITYYRAFLNLASSESSRTVLKELLKNEGGSPRGSYGTEVEQKTPLLTRGFLPLRTKDKFDIVTKLTILGDKDAARLLAELEKTETSDEAKRYAYAAKAGIATAENKAKFWNDFVNNKEISESYIESAFSVFNSPKHSELTLPYLEKALAELPNLKRNRKIFFVGGWLGSFIGGQKSEAALNVVNKFLADNPNLDKDLRLKILENVDSLERAVKIRAKYGK